MLKKILIGLGVLLIPFVGYVIYLMATTRSHSPAAVAQYKENGLSIEVYYCQPYKKGRTIFGEEGSGALLPYGQYWRTGANEATEIVFDQAVSFGGENVEAGRYRLYTFPGADKWTIALNNELGAWGYGEPDYDRDVLRVEIPSGTLSNSLEQFTIDFQGEGETVLLNFKWDKTLVSIPIKMLN